MSGCLQVGSARALSCYFSWLSLPNITCTHKHTHSYFLRAVCVSMSWMTTAASVVSSWIIVQLHSLPLSNAFPLPLSLSLSHSLPPLSMFPCFKHLSACDLFRYFFFTRFLESSFLCSEWEEDRERCTVYCSTWRTGEKVCLVCPEMALKPGLISRFCGASQLRCTVTPHWTAQDGPQKGLISDSALSRLSTKQCSFGYRFSYVSFLWLVRGRKPKCHTISQRDHGEARWEPICFSPRLCCGF